MLAKNDYANVTPGLHGDLGEFPTIDLCEKTGSVRQTQSLNGKRTLSQTLPWDGCETATWDWEREHWSTV